MAARAKSPAKGGYVTICEWMIRRYGLTGRQLMLYAIIHSFSQDGYSKFNGTLRYLSFWTGLSKQRLIVLLKELVDKELIQREEIPVHNNSTRHFVNYWTTFSRLSPKEQEVELVNIPERKVKKN